jgi:hypothetical protein
MIPTLLLLLTLQRSDEARWEYFTGCPQSRASAVWPAENLLTISLVVNTSDWREDYDRDPTLDVAPVSSGGGGMGPPPEQTRLGNTSKVREGNDLAVKIYWPEGNRTVR